MEVVKNILSDKFINSIPKGISKKDIQYRRNLIINELSKYVKTTIHNKYIKNKIKISGKSIKEIAYHASKGYNNTIKALNLISILSKSSVLYIDKHKDGKQLKEFYACLTVILHCYLAGFGEVKITIIDKFNIGQKNNDFYLYCIT